MHHLIIRRTINTPGKVDAREVFVKESDALAELLTARGDTVETCSLNELTPPQILARYTRQDTVSVFGHGWPRRCEGLPRRKRGAYEVAQWMRASGCEFLNLFACSCANADHKRGCFTRWVAEHCHKIDHTAQVFGHECSGHATWNPKARYYWTTPAGGVTTSKLWDPDVQGWKERAGFRERLKTDQEYRLLIPFIFED